MPRIQTLQDVPEKVDGTTIKNSKGVLELKNDFVTINDVKVKLGQSLEVESSVNVKNFGAKGDGINDDTTAIQEAINTGKEVIIPDGTFRITDELLITTLGQKISGKGCGEFFNQDVKGFRTKILIDKDTTITPYRKTRRNARASSSDADDAEISVAINIQAEAVELSDFILELGCDYTNTSSSNLGGDCDVGIFNGCRAEVKMHKINVLGYFRVASIYLDVTAGTTVANYSSPSYGQYPANSTNGCDRMHISFCHTKGGLKGLFLAGAKESSSGNYYDGLSDSVKSAEGGRGGSGASDLLIDQDCFFESRDHHSGVRATDPTMNTNTENTDNIACCIALDGRRGSTSQGRTRRINIKDTRLRTLEAARLFTDRVYELNINWLHSEPDSSVTPKNTSGSTIDITDYTNHSYGPIACKSTSSYNVGSDEIHIYGVWGTGIQEQWSDNLVTNFTQTRTYPDSGVWTPVFEFVTAPTYSTQSGNWREINGIIFCDFQITYSGLDTSDSSPINIGGLEQTISTSTAVIGAISFEKSTGWSASSGDGVILDNPSTTRIHLRKPDGTAYNYNSGQIQASGIIIGSFWFRD